MNERFQASPLFLHRCHLYTVESHYKHHKWQYIHRFYIETDIGCNLMPLLGPPEQLFININDKCYDMPVWYVYMIQK